MTDLEQITEQLKNEVKSAFDQLKMNGFANIGSSGGMDEKYQQLVSIAKRQQVLNDNVVFTFGQICDEYEQKTGVRLDNCN